MGKTCAERISGAKGTFQVLGALVGISFAVQGVVIFIGPAAGHDDRPLDDFWDACHWASEGTLCIIVGLTAVAFELHARFPRVASQLSYYAANRIGLSLLFLWLGCYSVGGRIQRGGAGWQLVGQVTGLTAWVVSVGHLVFSCCVDASAVPVTPKEAPQAKVVTDKPQDVETGGGATPTPSKIGAATVDPQKEPEPSGTWDNPFGEEKAAEELTPSAPPPEEPQWNAAGGKPFGCS